MQEAVLAKHLGVLVTADAGQKLDEVPGEWVRERVQKCGAVVLKGFSGGLEDFERFTRKIAKRFIHNGNDSRETLGDQGRTRSVTPGQNFIGPHSEFSYTPFRPDLLFFYCIRPAASGGASLLWDGRKIWDDMPEHLKKVFLNKRINYKFSGIDVKFFEQIIGGEESRDTCSFLDAVPGLSYKLHGEKVDLEYDMTAYVQNMEDGTIAFSNSIAVIEKTVMEDGSALSALDCAELLDVALRNTVTIDSSAGDVIVVDNWRVMHGRTSFEDQRRQMCIRIGYLNEQGQAPYSTNFEEIEF